MPFDDGFQRPIEVRACTGEGRGQPLPVFLVTDEHGLERRIPVRTPPGWETFLATVDDETVAYDALVTATLTQLLADPTAAPTPNHERDFTALLQTCARKSCTYLRTDDDTNSCWAPHVGPGATHTLTLDACHACDVSDARAVCSLWRGAVVRTAGLADGTESRETVGTSCAYGHRGGDCLPGGRPCWVRRIPSHSLPTDVASG